MRAAAPWSSSSGGRPSTMRPIACSAAARLTSSNATRQPACAQRAAMPLPMVPAPSTATDSISMPLLHGVWSRAVSPPSAPLRNTAPAADGAALPPLAGLSNYSALAIN
jgi:hypothetical protein